MKTVSQKMGIRENSRTLLINAPNAAINDIKFPKIEVARRLIGEFDYIHLFVRFQAEQIDQFPKLKAHLKPGGMLWVSWPKARQLDTDLSLPKVIHTGYRFGLVESTCLSINSVWSALKFTFPKEGKVYNNRYGTLNV